MVSRMPISMPHPARAVYPLATEPVVSGGRAGRGAVGYPLLEGRVNLGGGFVDLAVDQRDFN